MSALWSCAVPSSLFMRTLRDKFWKGCGFFNAVFFKLQILIGIQGTINSISNTASESGAKKRVYFSLSCQRRKWSLRKNYLVWNHDKSKIKKLFFPGIIIVILQQMFLPRYPYKWHNGPIYLKSGKNNFVEIITGSTVK